MRITRRVWAGLLALAVLIGKRVTFLCSLLCVVVMVMTWSVAECKPTPFRYVLTDTVSANWSTGEVKIRLIVKPFPNSLRSAIRIEPKGNIVIHRSLEGSVDFINGKYDTSEFSVHVPPHDTVGLEVFEEAGKFKAFSMLYFVTTAEPVEVIHGDPRHMPLQPPIESWFPGNFDTRQEFRTNEQPFVRRPVDSPLHAITVFDSSLAMQQELQESRRIDSLSQAAKYHFLPMRPKRDVPVPDASSADSSGARTSKRDFGLPKVVDSTYVISGSRIVPTTDVILSEDFSGGYPGTWSVGHNGGTTAFGWGWPNGYAYCAVGTDGIEYWYSDNIHAYMERTNISLTGYTSAKLSFYKLVDTEAGYDSLTVRVRDQSSVWHRLYKESGVTDPPFATYVELDLSAYVGQTGLRIQFRFDSDTSVSGRPYDGVYIDDVLLTAGTKPNLTPYKPTGWDYPIVPSTASGTHTLDVLVGEQGTFIDAAFVNSGSANIASLVRTNFYIDDVLVGYWTVDGLQANTYVATEDIQEWLSAGWHSLRIACDPDNAVDESDENDNQYEHSFYWQQPPSVTVNAHLQYRDLSLPGPTNTVDMRNVYVELWDEDVSGGNLLDTCHTTDGGYTTFWSASNREPFSGHQDVYLKVFARNDAAWVADAHSAPTYYICTPTAYEIADGTYSLGTRIPADTACGPYYIIDKILEGKRYFATLRPEPLGSVEVVWDKTDDTHYWNGYMKISNSGNGPEGYPDTYDNSVILHEYGHRIEALLQFFVTSPGGNHSWENRYTPGLAASEGWATCFSSMVRGDVFYKDSYNDFRNFDFDNLENGEYGYDGTIRGSANSNGDSCEGAVCGILWDIFDGIDDDYNHDGIGDTLDDCGTQMLKSLIDIDRLVGGYHAQNISQFLTAWMDSPSLGHIPAMHHIWYEHGAPFSCCAGTRGNVDGDPGEMIDISDMFAMVDYISASILIPGCPEEADIDASGSNDISDLFGVIDILTSAIPAPSCP